MLCSAAGKPAAVGAAAGQHSGRGPKAGAFSKEEDEAILSVLRQFAAEHHLSTTDWTWLQQSRGRGASESAHSKALLGLKTRVRRRTCMHAARLGWAAAAGAAAI